MASAHGACGRGGARLERDPERGAPGGVAGGGEGHDLGVRSAGRAVAPVEDLAVGRLDDAADPRVRRGGAAHARRRARSLCCIASLSSTHAPFVARLGGGHGARRGAHAPSLPSGLSPSAPEFHRISQPRGEGSRALTAGRDLHPCPARGRLCLFGCCPAKCKRPAALVATQHRSCRTPTGTARASPGSVSAVARRRRRARAWGTTSSTASRHSTAPFGRAGRVEHERPAHGAGDAPRQAAERVDQAHGLGQARGLALDGGPVPSGVRSRGPKPVPPVVTTRPAKPVGQLVQRRCGPTSMPSPTTSVPVHGEPGAARAPRRGAGPPRSSRVPATTPSDTTRTAWRRAERRGRSSAMRRRTYRWSARSTRAADQPERRQANSAMPSVSAAWGSSSAPVPSGCHGVAGRLDRRRGRGGASATAAATPVVSAAVRVHTL